MQNWNQYQAAYQAADQTIKDKLHSSLIPECVDDAIQKYELDSSHKRVLLQLFAGKIVGVVAEAQVVVEMRAAGVPAAAVIAKEIGECLATKKPIVADTSLTKEGVEIEPVVATDAPSTSTTLETNPDTLASELAATEAAFKELQPIRTMAHDMETLKHEEPVHQAASQETILNGQGNAGKNTDSQWGTQEN